jgi:hypothetical protein
VVVAVAAVASWRVGLLLAAVEPELVPVDADIVVAEHLTLHSPELAPEPPVVYS